MSKLEHVHHGLWRLREAINCIEADLSGKHRKRHNSSISQADHDIIMRLIRFAVWDSPNPEYPHYKPEDEDQEWYWLVGRQIGIDNTPDEIFWTMNKRLELLEQSFKEGLSIKELEFRFQWRDVKPQLRKLGLLPSSDPLK